MCLDKVTARKNLKKTAFGWKVVNKDDRGYYFPLYMSGDYTELKAGWNSEGNFEESDRGESYEAGVHAWVTRKDAYADHIDAGYGTAVVKVKLSGPICRGVQENKRALVYKKMIIIKEEKSA